MDRSKPPQGYIVLIANFTEPKLWAPGIEELGQIGPDNTAYEGAVATCWAHYDAFTLPARVALLRELADEFRMNVPGQDREFASDLAESAHIGYDTAVERIRDELLERARKLERPSGQ